MGIVAGVLAGALAMGLLALGFFLRRRRQAARTKDADPLAPHPNGGDNLEHGRGEQHQQRQLNFSSSLPITVTGSNGAGGGPPPPPAQQSSVPPPRPPPPAYAHGDAHRPVALPPAADRQHAAVVAMTNIGRDGKPVQSLLAAPTVVASQKPSSEEEITPPSDGNGSGDGRKATGTGGGCVDAAEYGGGRSAATELAVPPLIATNSTADVSTEERTSELPGLGYSAEEGDDDGPAATAAATAAAATAAAGGRRKTSSGVHYGEAVLAAAEELAHHCQIPGVSEAATAVSILIHLVSDSRDYLSRSDGAVKRCRSIVMMLERAAKVLGKVSSTPRPVCVDREVCCRLLHDFSGDRPRQGSSWHTRGFSR